MRHITPAEPKLTPRKSKPVLQPVEKPIRVNIFFPRELDVAVEIAAATKQTTKSLLVVDAVRSYLAQASNC